MPPSTVTPYELGLNTGSPYINIVGVVDEHIYRVRTAPELEEIDQFSACT